MARGGGHLRRAALTVFATLLLLAALGLTGEVSAQVTLTILQRDARVFEPASFSAEPVETVTLTLMNTGAIPHTFTLFAQPNADVPVGDNAALQAYSATHAKIVDEILGGGEQRQIQFTAPTVEARYVFVCMRPFHAAAGMHGVLIVGAPPTVAIIAPADGSTLTSTSVTVSGTASDDAAVDRVELSTDETNWVLVTGTTSWSGPLTLVEGSNTIFARATDTSSNTATVSITVTVDTTETPPGFQVSQTVIIVAGVVAAAVAGFFLYRRYGRRGESGRGEGPR